jgi:hypothetical protein
MLLQDRTERALGPWRTMPDTIPDGDTVCQLIESSVVEHRYDPKGQCRSSQDHIR